MHKFRTLLKNIELNGKISNNKSDNINDNQTILSHTLKSGKNKINKGQ